MVASSTVTPGLQAESLQGAYSQGECTASHLSQESVLWPLRDHGWEVAVRLHIYPAQQPFLPKLLGSFLHITPPTLTVGRN